LTRSGSHHAHAAIPAVLIWRPIDPGQHEYRREPANAGDRDLAARGLTIYRFVK